MSPIRPTGDTCDDCVTGGDEDDGGGGGGAATDALNTRSLEYILGAAAAAAALPFNVLVLRECCGDCRTMVADPSGGDADDA